MSEDSRSRYRSLFPPDQMSWPFLCYRSEELPERDLLVLLCEGFLLVLESHA